MINLTDLASGLRVLVNPDHIVSYWNSKEVAGARVNLTDTFCNVQETAEEIDDLLSELS